MTESARPGPLDRTTSLEQDEALLVASLRRLGHREWGHGSTRPRMRARLRDRVRELGLSDADYLLRLERDAAEQAEAARRVACAVSRFFRGGRVLAALRDQVLPALAAREGVVQVWSAGAARGEEAYSLAILWRELADPPRARLSLLASDIRADCLAEAREGVYEASSLRDLPPAARERWFRAEGARFRVAEELRRAIRFELHDLERSPWPRGFDLLLMRTLAFTYWGEELQRMAVRQAHGSLAAGGWLAIGRHEELPAHAAGRFERAFPGVNLFRRL